MNKAIHQMHDAYCAAVGVESVASAEVLDAATDLRRLEPEASDHEIRQHAEGDAYDTETDTAERATWWRIHRTIVAGLMNVEQAQAYRADQGEG